MKFSIRDLFLVTVTFLAGCGGNQSPRTPKAQAPVQRATTAATKEVTAIKRGYDTPEKAFAAYTKAMQAKEWGTAFDCLSPAMQRMEVLELWFAAGVKGSKCMNGHVDEGKLLKQHAALGAEPTEEQVMTLILKLMRDKRAFFIDAAQELNEELQSSVPQGPLKKVIIAGRQAQGVVISLKGIESPHGRPMDPARYEYQEKVYFVHGNDGWLMDAPPGAIGVVRDTEPEK